MLMSLHPALLCVVLAISTCRDGLFVEGLALSRRGVVRGVASIATIAMIATIAPSASAVDRQRMTAAAEAPKKDETEDPSSPDAIAARVDALGRHRFGMPERRVRTQLQERGQWLTWSEPVQSDCPAN